MVFTAGLPSPSSGPVEGAIPSDDELIGAFLAVMGTLGRHFLDRSAEFDLSMQQAKAFQELAEPLSMSELAERLYCDASNVTGIVDRLQARGLVERTPDPDDRRVRRLVLTDAGRELWLAHRERVYDGIPCVGNLHDGERSQLYELLLKMLGLAQPEGGG